MTGAVWEKLNKLAKKKKKFDLFRVCEVFMATHSWVHMWKNCFLYNLFCVFCLSVYNFIPSFSVFFSCQSIPQNLLSLSLLGKWHHSPTTTNALAISLIISFLARIFISITSNSLNFRLFSFSSDYHAPSTWVQAIKLFNEIADKTKNKITVAKRIYCVYFY